MVRPSARKAGTRKNNARLLSNGSIGPSTASIHVSSAPEAGFYADFSLIIPSSSSKSQLCREGVQYGSICQQGQLFGSEIFSQSRNLTEPSCFIQILHRVDDISGSLRNDRLLRPSPHSARHGMLLGAGGTRDTSWRDSEGPEGSFGIRLRGVGRGER